MDSQYSRHLRATDCALFLDFDGTLIDLAPTPQSVRIPRELVSLLRELLTTFATRVCIVTGRPVPDIRRFLHHLEIDVVGEHGAEMCVQGIGASSLPAWPVSWKDHLLTLDRCIPSLVVETKKTAVALHYRQQPELEPEVIQFAELLRSHAPSDYMVVTSNMTTEIRRVRIDKGTAIRTAMQTPRYHGRRPIFIADDETDIVGFDVVRAMGGLALHVGTDFDGKPANVRRWLGTFGNYQA